MENQIFIESHEPDGVARRIAAAFIRWASTLDLNPHEGMLRASVAPSDYMQVPDYPPMHDDIL